jgi:hypothetical protein
MSYGGDKDTWKLITFLIYAGGIACILLGLAIVVGLAYLITHLKFIP